MVCGAGFATLCVAMYAEGSVLVGPAPLCVLLDATMFVNGSGLLVWSDKARFSRF